MTVSPVTRNESVRQPSWQNQNWGWTAVAVIFMFLLAAIAVFTPADLADRSISASLGDQETTGFGR
jgi:hypothetical protein